MKASTGPGASKESPSILEVIMEDPPVPEAATVRLLPQYFENTRSRMIVESKQGWAWFVRGWDLFPCACFPHAVCEYIYSSGLWTVRLKVSLSFGFVFV